MSLMKGEIRERGSEGVYFDWMIREGFFEDRIFQFRIEEKFEQIEERLQKFEGLEELGCLRNYRKIVLDFGEGRGQGVVLGWLSIDRFVKILYFNLNVKESFGRILSRGVSGLD